MRRTASARRRHTRPVQYTVSALAPPEMCSAILCEEEDEDEEDIPLEDEDEDEEDAPSMHKASKSDENPQTAADEGPRAKGRGAKYTNTGISEKGEGDLSRHVFLGQVECDTFWVRA